MKLINKVIVTVITILVFSCNLTDLDFLDNPNAVSPDQAGIDFLYNNIQLQFENFYSAANTRGDGPGRLVAEGGGFTYNDMTSPATWNFIWNVAYARLFPDIEALLDLAEDDLDIHAGSALILQSYVLTTLVDFFGDVPWTEALQGTDVISPGRDPGADIYAAAEAMLDDAIARLSGTQAATPANDFFYDGDPDKWITLANTLKLRIYNNLRLVDAGASAKMQAIISAGDIIDSPGEDFVFQFGKQRLNPNSRHPFYTEYYESTDGFPYMSNYYMWLLHSEKRDANGDPLLLQDPRLRFYFYRQETNLTNIDPNAWSCERSDEPDLVSGLNFRPDSYTSVDPDMVFCITSLDGYWGRDHLNGSGIPPDGPLRTTYGLYPGGGLFDDNGEEFTQESGTLGGLGEGIWPILTSSFVYFIRAEAAEVGFTSEDARTLLEQGVRASMAKVRTFEKFIDGGKVVASDPVTGDDITLADVYLDPLDDDIDDYIANVLSFYDTPPPRSDKLDVIMKEYLIALFGNGLEAYNNIRRTGRPFNVQPPIDDGAGTFAWSAWYPADHVDLNANASQRESITEQPFHFAPMDVNSVR